MEYVIAPASPGYPPWAYFDDAFNEQELDALEALALSASEHGKTGMTDIDNTKVRRSYVHWEKCTAENIWLYERLEGIVQRLNAEFYRFQLIGFTEPLQFSRYPASNLGAYTWHQDFTQGPVRKLSLVMQLTSPDKYVGGELQIDDCSADANLNPIIHTVEKKRGRVVVFPSWTKHQVTSVTGGTRCSIVAWLGGEPFK